MNPTEALNQDNSMNSTQPRSRIALGVILLLPALFLCLTDLLIPTLRTFWLSLQSVGLFGDGGEFVGGDNYAFFFSDPNFRQSLSFTISSLVIRLLVVMIVPPFLAWAAAQLSRRVRLGLRVLLTLPVILFVPIAIAIAWVILLTPASGLFSSAPLGSPSGAPAILLFIDALYTFGLACGLGLIFYLPVWRRPDDAPPLTFKETRKTLLTTWGISMLAVIVLSLSTFTLSFVMTGGGPGNNTSTLGLSLYRSGFVFLRFGPAAAIGSILLLVTVTLGIVAGLLVIWTRLRLTTADTLAASEQGDHQMDRQQSKVLPSIVLVLTLIPVLSACFLSILPFGWAATQSFGENEFARLLGEISPGRILVNTFIPPFIAAVVQLLTAYLAALSIGALLPLGKRSEWLLLPFSPWLFITPLPLSLVNILSAQESGTLGTFAGLISPILVSVPALFILTIFFLGRAPRWQRASTSSDSSKSAVFFRYLVLPSLPLVGVLFLFLLFMGWQDFFWPLVANNRQEYYPFSVTLAQLLQSFSISRGGLALAMISFFVLISFFYFVAFALFQVLYLDRLVFYSEDRSSSIT